MNLDVQTISRLEDLPDFFTPAELSRVFGISKATAYRRVEDGLIPCLKIGRRRVISRTHLLNWLDHELVGGK